MAAFVFGALDVEVDGDFITFGDLVEEGGLVFEAFELDDLGVFAVFDFEDEFALGESAIEGLDVADGLNGASEFERGHGVFLRERWGGGKNVS